MKKLLGEFIGKTVEDAVKAAVAATGKTEEQLEVEVLEKGKVTFFGIGSVKAKIRVYEVQQLTDGERAVNFLNGLMEHLKAHAVARLVAEEEKIVIELDTDNTQSVIGKRGVTLDAIQSLAGAVANIGREEYKRVVVDCENYREKREETLRRVAQKTAEKAVRQGRKISLEPMSAYERRIIHAALADSTEVKTGSEGREPRRFVVVIPNELKPYNRERKNNNSFRGGKGSRGKFNKGERREKGSKFERSESVKPRREYTEEEKAARSRVGGGTGMGGSDGAAYKKNSSIVFGTFLGNSRKNESEENNQE